MENPRKVIDDLRKYVASANYEQLCQIEGDLEDLAQLTQNLMMKFEEADDDVG